MIAKSNVFTAVPLFASLLAVVPLHAKAAPIAIFSTGVDANGNLPPDGSVDPHWTVQIETYDNTGYLPCDGNLPSGGPFLTNYDSASYVGGPAYLPTSYPGGPSFYNLNTPNAGLIGWSTDWCSDSDGSIPLAAPLSSWRAFARHDDVRKLPRRYRSASCLARSCCVASASIVGGSPAATTP